MLGTLRKIGLDPIITSKPCREAQLVIAMRVLRIIAPGSKLANLTGLQPETAEHTLADELQLHDVEKPELYEAMDWLLKRQMRIENKLAKKHLAEVTSDDYPGERLIVCREYRTRHAPPIKTAKTAIAPVPGSGT